MNGVFKLKCHAQNNLWGKRGNKSLVAKLLSSADPSFITDDSEHYAELWMGTHPTFPSTLHSNGQTLSDWIKRNLSGQSDGHLPFLMKVLSIDKALAIQIHPDKETAERLHQDRPDTYTDPNHKPEMAVALTPFKALCGFRSIQEVAQLIKNIIPFKRVIGPKSSILLTASQTAKPENHLKAIQDCFLALLKQRKEVVTLEINSLLQKIAELESNGEDVSIYEPKIVKKLSEDHPGDVGIFAVYFMNVVDLSPGEAIFIDSNVPHSYISGDCIECMARSNNVVRAALSNKLCDGYIFCKNAEFQCLTKDDFQIRPAIWQDDDGVSEVVYKTGIPDFSLSVIKVKNGREITIKPLPSSSICLVLNGLGKAGSSNMKRPLQLVPGDVLFIAPDETVTIVALSEEIAMYRAYSS